MSSAPSRRTAVRWIAIAAPLLVVFVWSYWPTIGQLVAIWNEQADYSHGYLVVPLALAFAWFRRDSIPSTFRPAVFSGLTIMALSVAVRGVGLRYAFDSLDGYSMILWIWAAVLLLGGWSAWRWSLPSLLFLFFMVPLPFRIETLLSVHLQRVATALSCFLLQCLAQPAFAQDMTIMLGVHQLHVEQACSGLRMFMGAVALAFAFVIMTRRELWERALLLLSVFPIAILANSLRIVVTGLMYQWTDEQTAQKFSHDMAGLLMIPLTACMFAAVLFYLSRLIRTVELVGMDELVVRE